MPDQIDNNIISKRIWLEEKQPEKNVNALEPKKDDVIKLRMSYVHRSRPDQIRRRFLYDMFNLPQTPKPERGNDQNLMPQRLWQKALFRKNNALRVLSEYYFPFSYIYFHAPT